MPEFDTRPQPESYPPAVPEKSRPPAASAKSHLEHASRSGRPARSPRSTSQNNHRNNHDRNTDASRQDPNVGMFDAISAAAQAPETSGTNGWQPPRSPNTLPPNSQQHHYHRKPEDQPRAQYFRRPPEYPMLAPEFQYCKKDGFVKPMRAHHCRTCATVSDEHNSFVDLISGLHSVSFSTIIIVLVRL